MKKRLINKIFISAVCLLLALCATVLCGCNTAQEEQTEAPTEAPVLVKAVRVKDSMTAGSAVAIKDVEVVDVYSNELPEGYLTKATEVGGRRLLVDVTAGQFLADSMLEAKETNNKPAEDGNDNLDSSAAKEKGYVVITDYVNVVTGVDLSADIQKVIDENPNSTIYFPDGTYYIGSPILTSSDPTKAVSIYMSNFAILKATPDWSDTEHHMLRLGAKDKSFKPGEVGSNYYLHGGIIDGSFLAKGVSVEGGCETSIRYVSMKFVTQGLQIMHNFL